MNKVKPEKLESIAETARKGFQRLGLELLGVIPRENMLEQSTLERICEDISGSFLHRTKHDRTRVAHVRIGAMSSANVFRGVSENTLLVVPETVRTCPFGVEAQDHLLRSAESSFQTTSSPPEESLRKSTNPRSP
jgi:hypothetical protein